MSQQITTLGRVHNVNEVATTRSRDRSIDLARGLALVFMVAVHVIIFWGFHEDSAEGSMVCALVAPIAAPTFLFLMGICFALSSKTWAVRAIFRGMQLFALGYLLNFLRGTLPVYLGLRIGWIAVDNATILSPWNYLIEIDILQCVGLCLVIMAIVRKSFPWPWVWAFLAALAIAGISIPPGASATSSAWAYCQALLVGASEYVYFPNLPWIAFPLAGMAYGALRKRAGDQRQFDGRAALLGAAMVSIGAASMFSSAPEVFRRLNGGLFLDGKLPAGIAIAFVGVQLLWLPLCGFVVRTVDVTPAAQRLYRWSENVTVFYVVQWIIIGWLCVLFPQMPLWGILPVIASVLFLTDATITQIEKIPGYGGIRVDRPVRASVPV